MYLSSPQLSTPRLLIRMADYRDAPKIARYYAENRAFLAPFEPTRSDEFFTQRSRDPFQACMVGYSLAKDKQGKGYMQEALRVAIGYIFDVLNYHRVMANYMPRNQRSGNLLKKLGFVVEGYARDYLQINGKWEDHILTSLINPNWKEN